MRFKFKLHKEKDSDLCELHCIGENAISSEFKKALYYFVRGKCYTIKKATTSDIKRKLTLEFSVIITDEKSIECLKSVTRGQKTYFAKALLRSCIGIEYLHCYTKESYLEQSGVIAKSEKPKQLKRVFQKEEKAVNDNEEVHLSESDSAERHEADKINTELQETTKQTSEDDIEMPNEDVIEIEDSSGSEQGSEFDIFSDFKNMTDNY